MLHRETLRRLDRESMERVLGGTGDGATATVVAEASRPPACPWPPATKLCPIA